jgi:3-phenylpropionate/cinnamic acid dioxygenase small subunit
VDAKDVRMDDPTMRDEWAIGRVLARYCRYLDDQRYDDVVSLFSPDGVLDSMGTRVEGREAIRAFFPSEGPVAERPASMHVLSNALIDVDGDTARAESDWVMIQREETGTTSIVLAGRYRDEFERLEEGWRLSSRTPVVLARRTSG